MGLFSNPCPNEDCSARVKKRAHFCSKCGWAGPNSLTVCPDCTKKVGRASAFCWSCGADLRATAPPRIAGGRWVRSEEEFAVRVYPADLEGSRARRVTVEPGTHGIVEREGRLVKDVDWGTQTLDGILSLHQPSSIILVSTSDAVIRPSFGQASLDGQTRAVRDANGAELDVTVQLVFAVGDLEKFVGQFLGGHKRRVTLRMIEETLKLELFDFVRAHILGRSIEEMYGNLEWRGQFEDELRAAMTATLDRYGLTLLQLNFVDFAGDTVEQLQEEKGEIYMGSRAADYLAEKQTIRLRIAQLEAEGKLGEFKTEKDLAAQMHEAEAQFDIRTVMTDTDREETVRQAWHELELKSRLRTFEAEDLERERSQQTEDEDRARQHEIENLQTAHDNDMAMGILIARNQRDATEAEFLREQERLSNAQVLEQEWARFEQDLKTEEAGAAQRFRLLVEESKANLDAAKFRTQQQIEELEGERKRREADLDDEGARQKLKMEYEEHQVVLVERMQRIDQENLAALKRLEIEEKKLDQEVRLAEVNAQVAIAQSEERTSAAVSGAVTEELRKVLDDQKRAMQDQRQDANRRADDLNRMAQSLGGNQGTVVVAGAGGATTVGGHAQDGDTAPCPKCQRPVALADSFCRKCGHNMQQRD